MAQAELKIIWQSIKERFLYYWVLGTIFIMPLLIFNYGFNASIIRQLVLFFLVIIGWLIWASPAVLHKQPLAWQRSIFNLPALILLVAVLVNSLLASDIFQVWGGRGVLGESNPWGVLAALGLGLLLIQVIGRKKERIQPFLSAYLLSVAILAWLVLLWWIFGQQLVIPAWTSFPAASLLFTVNAIIIAALSLSMKGKVKLFWLAILLAHVAVIFAYDYDLSWYVLAAGGLVLAVAQLLLEKRLSVTSASSVVDFRTPFALIILSLVLLFVPVKSVSSKLGFDAASLNTVGASVAWPRFVKYAPWREKLLGAGLGQGTEQFWQLAELVDMRQIAQFPPVGSLWGGLLWDGGSLLILAWLAALSCLFLGIWRSVKKASNPNWQAILTLGIGAAGYLAISALMPLDWFCLFSLIILAALLSAILPGRKEVKIGASHGQRAFLSFGAAALAIGWLAGLVFAGRQIKNRLDFFNSVQVGSAAQGTTVDLGRLDGVIKRTPRSWGFRLGRIDFFRQALDEQSAKPGTDLKSLLAALSTDLDYLASQNLPAEAAWQMAATAEKVAAKADKDEAINWQKRAAVFYEKAIAGLPRNVIFFTEAARFYRQLGSSPPARGGVGGEGAEAGNPEKYYQRARELVDKALGIDNTYEAAYGEKAELLVLAGKTEEAFNSLKAIADQSPSAAYSAARLAFTAKKYDEAVVYYRKTIAQNPNHLQARYELVQALMALSDTAGAKKELEALAGLVPKDDAQTQAILKGLQELLK